jgi:hypothetical protein
MMRKEYIAGLEEIRKSVQKIGQAFAAVDLTDATNMESDRHKKTKKLVADLCDRLYEDIAISAKVAADNAEAGIGEQGDLFVQKAPAATIETLAKAVIELTDAKTGISYIGTRHGEKLYETLVTQEEMLKSIDMGNFFCIKADNRDLNYDKYFSMGNKKLNLGESYTSHNTGRLDVEGMKELLKKLELFGGPVRQHE